MGKRGVMVSVGLLVSAVLATSQASRAVGPKLESAFVEALTRSHNASRIASVLGEIASYQKIDIQPAEVSRSAELLALLSDRSEVQRVLTRMRIIEPPEALNAQFTAIKSDAPAPDATLFEDRLKLSWRAQAGVFQDASKSQASMKDVVIVTSAGYGHQVYFNNWECIAKRYELKYLVLSTDHVIHALAGSRSILLPGARTKDELLGKTSQSSLNAMGCAKLAAVSHLLNDGASVAFIDINIFFKHDPTVFLTYAMQYDYTFQAKHVGCAYKNQHPAGSCLAPNSGFYFVSAKKPSVRRMWRIALNNCRRHVGSGPPIGATEGGGEQRALQRTLNDVLGMPTHWNKNINRPDYNHRLMPAAWAPVQHDLPASSPFGSARWCATPEAGTESADTFDYCVLEPVQYPAQRHLVVSSQVIAAGINRKEGHSKRRRLKLMAKGLWVWASIATDGPEGRCLSRSNATALGLMSNTRRHNKSKKLDSETAKVERYVDGKRGSGSSWNRRGSEDKRNKRSGRNGSGKKGRSTD